MQLITAKLMMMMMEGPSGEVGAPVPKTKVIIVGHFLYQVV